MTGTAEQMRAWRGPALLSYGFRPFFFGAGIWASLVMVIWISLLNGILDLPIAFDPVSWHAHEFLYGYLSAVIAGFLFTAVPNWTGRLPIVGWPLGAFFALWIVGRIAIALSAGLSPILVAAADLAFPLVLAVAIAREIIKGRNWRNLIVLAMLGVLIAGNLVFHWEAAHGDYAARGMGLRIGLAAAVMLIAIIGGRIVPSFTRNWLARQSSPVLPAPPMQRFDKVALSVLAVALLLWIVLPHTSTTGLAMLLAGGMHSLRLARWAGDRTASEPLVLVLHAGFAFVPLGALAIGTAILEPEWIDMAAAQHVWMAGAIGVMTVAVMTRATLGHTGRALTADLGTVMIYILLIVAVLVRALAGLTPSLAVALNSLAGLAWIAAFSGFSVLYGRYLLRSKVRA
ncbi:NnrS family protein [Chelativorans sp. AA-79]|uniref:NnrS family protein n=1 Tax=Chelativorans sp. AA-79 TaxID=3028735 RepID=UPI0023F71648|nr:NnrS family protein [Chelativorans sp. AA-79]WEX08600.1 NnrS family protein [Chelativorans sp. AA-79]